MRVFFSATPGRSFGWPEDVMGTRPDVMMTFWDLCKSEAAGSNFTKASQERFTLHKNTRQHEHRKSQ